MPNYLGLIPRLNSSAAEAILKEAGVKDPLNLHCTIVYLGDKPTPPGIYQAMESVQGKVQAEVLDLAIFGDKRVLVLDDLSLSLLRAYLLASALHEELPRQFGTKWTPHITLGNIGEIDSRAVADLVGMVITFSDIVVKRTNVEKGQDVWVRRQLPI